jgi:hypothetical protein
MAHATTDYKIVSFFVIILASVLGAALPFLYIRTFYKKHNSSVDMDALNTQPAFFVAKAMTCKLAIY